MNNCLSASLIFFFRILGFARFLAISTTFTELYVGIPTKVLTCNKSMEVRIDNFSRYAEFTFEIFQYRLFEVFRNNDDMGISRFKKAIRRSNEYAFLYIRTTLWYWVPRCFNPFAHRPIFVLQNNPTFFKRGSVTSEKKSYAVVSCEVNQVGFTSKVLNFG